jgi:phosphatidylethanolamine N-methyltransferase
MLVKHFLKHYPYPVTSPQGRGNRLSVGKAAAKEAFENWKELYNLSLCMTYGAFSTVRHI